MAIEYFDSLVHRAAECTRGTHRLREAQQILFKKSGRSSDSDIEKIIQMRDAHAVILHQLGKYRLLAGNNRVERRMIGHPRDRLPALLGWYACLVLRHMGCRGALRP